MAALEKTRAAWNAQFVCDRDCGLSRSECSGYTTKRVAVVRTKWDYEPTPYFWTMVDFVGVWPGTESDEWIEVVW